MRTLESIIAEINIIIETTEKRPRKEEPIKLLQELLHDDEKIIYIHDTRDTTHDIFPKPFRHLITCTPQRLILIEYEYDESDPPYFLNKLTIIDLAKIDLVSYVPKFQKVFISGDESLTITFTFDNSPYSNAIRFIKAIYAAREESKRPKNNK